MFQKPIIPPEVILTVKINRFCKDNRGIGIVGIIVIVAIVATVAVVGYLIWKGRGLGIGNGAGNGEGDGNTQIVTNQEKSSDEETNVVDEEVETHEQNDDAIDEFDGDVVKITVSENEYVYDSEKTTLDDFIAFLNQKDGEFIVKIKDENASLKAYNALIDLLEENHIQYVEG